MREVSSFSHLHYSSNEQLFPQQPLFSCHINVNLQKAIISYWLHYYKKLTLPIETPSRLMFNKYWVLLQKDKSILEVLRTHRWPKVLQIDRKILKSCAWFLIALEKEK